MTFRALIRDKKALKAELFASLSLCWPIVLTNLSQTAMVSTNLRLMGRKSADTLAAGALGTNLFYVFMVFGSALMITVSPLVAVELGRNKYSVRDVRRSVRQGFWAAITILVPIWIILWNSEKIFLLMRQEPHMAAIAGHYAFVLMWSLLPLFGYMILRAFLATLERPGWTLVFGLAAIPINYIVARGLMFGEFGMPQLGLTGIGIAIFTADLFMFLGLVIIICTDRKFRRYHLFGDLLRPDWPRYRALWRIGCPIALTSTFETTVFNVAAFAMALIGTQQMAAHAVVAQISAISFMVPFGIAQAATVRVGRCWGAGDSLAVMRAGWTCLALGVSFMVLTAFVMTFAPLLLIGIFLDVSLVDNAAAVVFAKQFLIFAALFQIADGAQTVSTGMLRGLHDTRIPMFIAAVGYWGITIPLSMVLAFYTSYAGLGIWIGFAVGLFIVAVLMVYRWVKKSHKSII